MERIIDIYYDRYGYPFKDRELTVRFPVAGSEFLGASQTTTIRFHYEQIGTDENVYTVESKRPDGKPGSELLSKNTTEHYAEMSLSGWYSECKGDLFLSLKVYRGGTTATYNETTQLWEVSGVPVIESTGAIKLSINYTPMGRYENYEDAVSTYQDVLAALGDKLDTIKGIVGVSGLSQVDTTEYEEGQLFFDVDTKNIYKLESGEFVKINNKLEIVDVSGYEYEELFSMFGTQPFMSYYEENTNIAIYQFKQNGSDLGGYALYVWTYNNGCLYISIVDMSAIFSIDDFTNLEYEKAPVVVLNSDSGTLSDFEYEQLLQPNASVKLENYYYVKFYEDDYIIEFRNYFVGQNSSNSYVGYYIIIVRKEIKSYTASSYQELFYDKTKIDQLLTAKQDKLVSGTSIKTINNVSLLGSGNIDIQGGSGDAEWGSIGGNIADQTDLQDELQDIREVAEGKTSTYVIYDDVEGPTEQTFIANEYNRADGTPIATWADFLSYVEDSNTCSNTLFDDDSVYKIDVGYTYLITVYNRIIKTNTLKNGDNIIVVQLDVPDRWYNEEDGCAYPLETSKVNLDNYSTKTETSTEVNKVAHDIAVEYDEDTLYGSGDLCIKDKLLYKCNTNNTTGTWDSTKWDLTNVNSELGVIKGSCVDLTSAQTITGEKTIHADLCIDNSNYKYYLVDGNFGQLKFARGSKTGPGVIFDGPTIRASALSPQGSSSDIGSSGSKWRDLFLSRYLSDGTNSVTVAEITKKPSTSYSLTDGGTITDSTLKTLIQNEQPIKLNGFTCYFSCDDGTNYQYVSTRYDAVANKNHINVITINKTTWVATFHTRLQEIHYYLKKGDK